MVVYRRHDLHRNVREPKVSKRTRRVPNAFLILNQSTALYIASLVEVGSGKGLTRVEIAAIAWGVNVLSGIMNTVGTKAIGRMSAFNVWWTLGGTFVLVITLLVKTPVKVCC